MMYHKPLLTCVIFVYFVCLVPTLAGPSFLKQCKLGYVDIASEVKERIFKVLPDTTINYLTLSDKFMANLIDKSTSSNIQSLALIKPLLDLYVLPCMQPSKYLNSSLTPQLNEVNAQKTKILTEKYLSCKSIAINFTLEDLIHKEEITSKVDITHLTGYDTPLSFTLNSINNLLSKLMGTHKNLIMYKMPWLVKNAISNMLKDVSEILVDFCSDLTVELLSSRSEVLLGAFGDRLEAIKCTIIDHPEVLTEICEVINTAIENVFTMVYVDMSKSYLCLENKYKQMAGLKRLEDISNLILL